MGLIKEPLIVDFFVIDKSWSDIELKEFSEIIKKSKSQKKLKEQKNIKSTKKIQNANV